MAVCSRVQIRLPALAAAAIFITACGHENGAAGTAGDVSADRFEQINREWRQRRAARLTEPYGWLSLVELAVLEPGSTVTIGSGPENDVVVDRGPARWGTLHVAPGGDHVDFENAAGDAVVFGGDKAASGRMTPDHAEAPTRIESEGIRMHLVDPGGRLALRVRDPQAPTRSGFVGLDYYDLEPGWRIEAEFIEHPQGTTLQVANVMGQLIEEPNPGRVRFTHDGKTIELEAVLEDDRLFFIFADRTSGRETYGLGRFLYADLPDEGRVTLDFNQAYNPPCAFNAYTTCPLPPQANRIDAWIRAGERAYAGQPGIESPRTPLQP